MEKLKKEIEELKNEIYELRVKVSALELDITHVKAVEIVRARQIEDSILNRSLLKDMVSLLGDKGMLPTFTAETKEMLDKVLIHGEVTGILDELKMGRTIQAIKTVRQITGAGLKEAKDIVDEIRSRFGIH